MAATRKITSNLIAAALAASALIGLSTAVLAGPSGGLLDGHHKIRIIITSDIDGTDPNDEQSFGHFLIYSFLFDIEGLITSAPGGKTSGFHAGIDAYEKDYNILRTWSVDYPDPDQLRSVVRAGKTTMGMGELNDGARLIIEAAKRDDLRPLHIVAWGSMTNESIAVKYAPEIVPKLRLHGIGPWNTYNGDPEANDYLRDNHQDVWWIIDRQTFRGASCGGNQEGDLSDDSFQQYHVAGHGALGDWTASHLDNLKLNQSTTILYLLRGDPYDPTAEHWGGQFATNTDNASVSPTFWSDMAGHKCGIHNGAETVNKWREEWLRDWQEKIDRCLKANHVIYVNKGDPVCGGNSPCYTSIQEGVNAASTGFVIRMAQGTYSESFTLNTSKSLTLQGGWNSTFTTQTSNTTFIKAPKATQGSITVQEAVIRP